MTANIQNYLTDSFTLMFHRVRHNLCVHMRVCVCVCVWCACCVCVVLALLLCINYSIILYYFKGMYDCVYVFVLCCIIVVCYCYITALHYMRRLQGISVDLSPTNTILTTD